MELKWLEDFLALARTGSFSQAARDRHVTQPAFSRRVRALEHWLGVSLVDRSMSPLALTQYGEEFLPHAQEIVATSSALRQDFRLAARTERMQVRIVTLHTLAVHLVPGLTTPFLRAHPQASVEIIPSLQGVESYFEALTSGMAHVVIAYGQQRPIGPQAGDLVSRVIARDEFVPVATPALAAAIADKPAKLPVARYTPFNFSHALLSSVYDSLGARMVVKAESTLGETLKAYALAGVGVAWVPRFSVRAELASGALVTLAEPGLTTPIDIVAWRRRQLEEGLARSLFDSWSTGAGDGR
jgi:DNA-binding transcriptional LysR family regulator